MKKVTRTIQILFCFFFLCSKISGQNFIQNKALDTTSFEQKKDIDPLGRSNPRETVRGFLKSISNNDYLKASQYIDLPKYIDRTNDSLMITLLQQIEVTLNKFGTINPVRIISNSTDGNTNDGLNSTFERIGTLKLDNSTIPILLELVSEEKDSKYWMISSETIKELISYINTNKIAFDLKPNSTSLSSKWLGVVTNGWFAMIALALASYFLAWLFTLFIAYIVRLFWKHFIHNKFSKFLKTLLIPLRLVFAVVIVLHVSRLFGIPIVVRQGFSVVNLIAMWSALFIFVWLLIDALSSFGEERLRDQNIFSGLSAISFLKNSAKFSLIVIAILITFETLGYNITAGIAALGFGGIALALGAQKTVENIVGGLSVVFDQPVSVGDFCKFGNTVGTVEKIGMRSTRIRTLGRTVVTIPNADFSSQSIENYSKRDLFLFQTTLGLRYETSSHQMRYILRELRNILYAHPKVDPEPARVRFIGYGSDALKVEIYAYIRALDWNGFLGVQEDINLRIAKVIEDSGSGFAFPSQTLYLSKDQTLSESKRKAAEAKVKKWIKDDELGLPEFDEKTIEKLKNSLQYPTKSIEESGE